MVPNRATHHIYMAQRKFVFWNILRNAYFWDICKFPFRYDHPHILAGQGTCGLEMAEQVDNIDAAIIPVGGAGLIAGCAVALKVMQPNIKIYVNFVLFNWFL